MRVPIIQWLIIAAALLLSASQVAYSAGTAVYIYNINATGITSASATINWSTLLPASSQLAYGKTPGYGNLTTLDSTLVTSHSQTISGLDPNTSYHYQVISVTGNGTQYVAGDFTFLTSPNIVQGMVSGVNVSGITESSAIINWTTNTPASSQVQYGTTANAGTWTGLDPALVVSHSVMISQLTSNTTYHFSVWSIDAAGRYGVSSDAIFTTLPSSAGSALNAIAVPFLASTSATITWSTDTPSSSQVDYGISFLLGSTTVQDPTLTTIHSITLGGLTPNTTYVYRVQSMDVTGGVLTSTELSFTTPVLTYYLPQMRFTSNQYTGVALTNLDQSSATIGFSAFAGAGNQLSHSSNPITLVPGSQSGILVDQLFSVTPGDWQLGWTSINSSSPLVSGFFLTFDTGFTLMDGATMSSSLLDSFVFPESLSQGFTDILLGNPNGASARVDIDLVKTDGTIRSTFQTSIPPFATYTGDLARNMFATASISPSDYLRLTASVPLVPYEFTGNASKDIAVVAGQASTSGATTLYAPQYAVGGPYDSSLSILNLDSTPGTVTLTLFAGNGLPLGNRQIMSIAGNGKIFISDPSFFFGTLPTQLTDGYVVIASDGVHLSGIEMFSDAQNGIFLTSLPLISSLQQMEILSDLASDTSYFTGLAILNPNTVDATVTIQVYTATSQLDQSLTLTVPAGNRISRLLTEYFPQLNGQSRLSGYIKITADQGIACFGVFGTNSLSVLSAIPAQPAP